MNKVKEVDCLNQVTEFHEVFDLPVLDSPQIPAPDRVELRLNLIEEELKELREALASGDVEHSLKEWTDLLYVVAGAALEFGFQGVAAKAFNEVHRSNLSKVVETEEEADREAVTWAMKNLGEAVDVSPIYFQSRRRGFVLKRQRDGKVLKPSTYSPADLSPIFQS